MGHFLLTKGIKDSIRNGLGEAIGRNFVRHDFGNAVSLFSSEDNLYSVNYFEDENVAIGWQGEIWHKSNPEKYVGDGELAEIVSGNIAHIHQKISGNFALIFINKETSGVYVLSDKYNTVPVFYVEENGNISIGTEYESLLPLIKDREINGEAVAQYFLHDSCTEGTFLKKLKKMRGNSVLHINGNTLKIMENESQSISIDTSLTAETAASRIADIVSTALNRTFDRYSKEDIILTLSGGMDSRMLLSLTEDEHRKALNVLTIHTKHLSPQSDTDVIIARKLSEKVGLNHFVEEMDVFDKSLSKGYFSHSRNLGYNGKKLIVGTYGGELMTGAMSNIYVNYTRSIMGQLPKLRNKITNYFIKNSDYEFLNQVFTDIFLRKINKFPSVLLKEQYHKSGNENKELSYTIDYLSGAFFSNVYRGSIGAWTQPYKNQTDKLTIYLNPELLDFLLSLPKKLINDAEFKLYHALYSKFIPEFNDVSTNNAPYTHLAKSVIPKISVGKEPKDFRVSISEKINVALPDCRVLVEKKIIRPEYLSYIEKERDDKALSKVIDLSNWLTFYGL